MTIRGLAEQLGVKPITVYRRLSANGVDVATLRNAHKDLTDEGVRVIAALFDGASALHDGSSDANQPASGVANHATVQGDMAAQVEIAVLKEKLRAAEEQAEGLRAERDRLQAQVDALMAMLATEQQQRQLLLTDGQRRGLFAWLRRKG